LETKIRLAPIHPPLVTLPVLQLEKFETFANLNCELSTKIEQLESSAPSTATNDGLIKKNEKLKAKLASSQEAIENLLGKMEIYSIHNNELTTKLENIGNTPEVSLVEMPSFIKKDASTSCFELIDTSCFELIDNCFEYNLWQGNICGMLCTSLWSMINSNRTPFCRK
jgi:FtsZ-binding cell division protein ZapB